MLMDSKMIGLRIRETRLQSNLSQAALAERIDKSSTFISRLESGIKKPSLETLMNIAHVFDVPIDYLLNNTQSRLSMSELLFDCTPREIEFIVDIVLASKACLRKHM